MTRISGIALWLAALMMAALSCSREPSSFEEELRHTYKDERGFFYLKVPPALMRLVMNVENDKEMLEVLGNARQVGIISFGEGFPVSKNPELLQNLEGMMYRYNYEDLIKINEQGREINVKIRENNGNVTDLITLISQPEDQVMLFTISGDIDISTVVEMASLFDYGNLIRVQSMLR